MKQIGLGLSVIAMVILVNSPSLAERCKNCPPGSGQRGSTFYFGYERPELDYSEYSADRVIGTDKGSLAGGYFAWRYDDRYSFLQLSYNVSKGDNVTSKGKQSDGTSYNLARSEKISEIDLISGSKMLNFSAISVAPYLGIGYRSWIRGSDSYLDYKREYDWSYGDLGVNIVAARLFRFTISVNASAIMLFNPVMKTTFGNQVDSATFKLLPSHICSKADVNVSMDLYKGRKKTTFLFINPYREKWIFGASEATALTQYGSDVASEIAPKGKSKVTGIRSGIGIKF